MTDVSIQYNLSLTSKNILLERKKFLLSELNNHERSFSEKVLNTIDERVSALRQKVFSEEDKLDELKAIHGESHEGVIAKAKKLEKLQKELRIKAAEALEYGVMVSDPIAFRQSLMDTLIKIDSDIALYEINSNKLGELINKYDVELSDLSDKTIKFMRLKRDLDISSETYAKRRP